MSDDTFTNVALIIAEVTGKEHPFITPAKRLADVVADSLEFNDLMIQLDVAFDIDITEAHLEKVGTVGELVDLVDRLQGQKNKIKGAA